MKVLIVDGNEKSASDRYTELGMLTQYEVYKKVLENIADIELDIIVIHPFASHKKKRWGNHRWVGIQKQRNSNRRTNSTQHT